MSLRTNEFWIVADGSAEVFMDTLHVGFVHLLSSATWFEVQENSTSIHRAQTGFWSIWSWRREERHTVDVCSFEAEIVTGKEHDSGESSFRERNSDIRKCPGIFGTFKRGKTQKISSQAWCKDNGWAGWKFEDSEDSRERNKAPCDSEIWFLWTGSSTWRRDALLLEKAWKSGWEEKTPEEWEAFILLGRKRGGSSAGIIVSPRTARREEHVLFNMLFQVNDCNWKKSTRALDNHFEERGANIEREAWLF